MTQPNFIVSEEDGDLIRRIVARVAKHHYVDLLTLSMDLSATHNTCPLRLEELLVADDSDFYHDIYGIQRHINRDTGELTDCFRPRYAK